MHLVRYRTDEASDPVVGVLRDGLIRSLTTVSTIGELLRLPLPDFRSALEAPDGPTVTSADVELLAPIDGRTEVWAAGVTYLRSRQARVEESADSADVYQRVYDADRPELFFKSAAWRVVGHGLPIAVRDDSAIDVPEPELALVLNAEGEIVGYTVCDDVSSRSIEGENPLYLPQAKVYLGGCAVGPSIRPVWEIGNPYRLAVSMEIRRDGRPIWNGESNTSQLARRFEDLAACLGHADHFPDGVILSTGTSLVPDLPFTLTAGDVVSISISEIGTLTNPVVQGKSKMSWMHETSRDPHPRRGTER